MALTPVAVTTGAWVWEKYGKSVTNAAVGALKTRWDKVKWKDAEERYRARIKKLYGTMQIMGMVEPVPLDDIFTDAYMLDKPTAFARFDIEHLKRLTVDSDAPPEAERINGLRLVVEKGNLFVLGKPGAGKTTFLKYIALKAAEQTINKVPILVSLKEWADTGSELMSFIAERFEDCDFPAAQAFVEELLRSGNAIVLFDGLDEVNQESGQRDKQTRAINNFVAKYDHAQCLITCRIAASDYSFQPFTYVEIADFTEQQIRTFVGNWFRKEGERDEATRDMFLAEFLKADNRGLRDLARTPLLLTLLCLAFNNTLTFPQRRVEIYEEALDALLKKWDSSRRIKRDDVYRTLSLGHKENMLARIAAETFEKNEYFIPQRELERQVTNYVRNVPPHQVSEAIDGEAILKAIEHHHGLLVARAHGVYSFSHLTFQEYFTARYIVANATKGTLARLITAHCADKRWREVFLLTTSLMSDASEFITTFRRTVDALLEGDEQLRKLLYWAEKKSAPLRGKPWLVRPSYLFITFYYGTQNEDLNLALARALGLNSSLELALAQARDLDSYVELEMARKRDLNRANARDLSIDASRALARANAYEVGLNNLIETLASLSNNNAPAEELQAFADKLRTFLVKRRDTRHRSLDVLQEERLVSFLNATRLLRDCLELAFMPPDEKKAILNSLYLPPVVDVLND